VAFDDDGLVRHLVAGHATHRLVAGTVTHRLVALGGHLRHLSCRRAVVTAS
jgi:hypothetical protein